MNLTFLDASTLAPADLDFGPLEQLGTLTTFPTTSPAETTARCQNADVIITNKVLITADTFQSCPNLKLILIAATGTNCVDLDAAKSHRIPVCNVAGYSSNSVAQHTFALLLNLATNVHRYSAEAKLWPDSPIFTRLDHPATELAGKTLGIAGLGDIGSAVANIAQSFGMHVQALAREGSSNSTQPDTPRVDRNTFFSTSDVISLHCPLTPETKNLINADTLVLMKQSAVLINTSRGPLVNEAALAYAIRTNSIAGAGLDVLAQEPPSPDNPLLAPTLLSTGRLLITPHTAWISHQARQSLLAGITANLQSFLNNTPTNRVA
ncbi:MAG: D-2-hydroxyacid dehydrogenase [Akkermansiaceae bacterium]|nr:D-2-hydroxyacid dehydrogenase [Akkermansiaceae bacterium]